MMKKPKVFAHGGMRYKAINDTEVAVEHIMDVYNPFVEIPESVIHKNRSYQVVGLLKKLNCPLDGLMFETRVKISFDDDVLPFNVSKAFETIRISKSIKFIHRKAFENMNSLNNIICEGNPLYYTEQETLFSHFPHEAVIASRSIRSIHFRELLIAIRPFAFEGCIFLTSVRIPSSVIKINKRAFANAVSLEKLKFGRFSQIEEIEDDAFFKTKLSKIRLPSSLKRIGSFSFNTQCENQAVMFDHDSNLSKVGLCAFNRNVTIIGPMNIRKKIEHRWFL